MFIKLPNTHNLKINKNIKFNNNSYHLKATLNHHGAHVNTGHWTTTLCTINNELIELDDSEIYPTQQHKNTTIIAYELLTIKLPPIPQNINMQPTNKTNTNMKHTTTNNQTKNIVTHNINTHKKATNTHNKDPQPTKTTKLTKADKPINTNKTIRHNPNTSTSTKTKGNKMTIQNTNKLNNSQGKNNTTPETNKQKIYILPIPKNLNTNKHNNPLIKANNKKTKNKKITIPNNTKLNKARGTTNNKNNKNTTNKTDNKTLPKHKHPHTNKPPNNEKYNSAQNKRLNNRNNNNHSVKIKREKIRKHQEDINNSNPKPHKKPKISKVTPIFFDLCDNHLAIYYTYNTIALDINLIFNKEPLPSKLIHSIHLILLNLKKNIKYSEITIYNKTIKLEQFFIEVFSNKNKNNKINETINKIKNLLKTQSNTIRVKAENNHKIIDRVSNLARKFDNNCWKFNPAFLLNTITELNLPAPTIDCFASSCNKQCNLYFSEYNDMSNLGTNLFKQVNFTWNAHIAWANPPYTIKILDQTTNFFINNQVTGYMLTPQWNTAGFWKLANKKSNILITFPIHKELFFPAHNNYTKSVGPPKWPVSLFYFNPNIESKRQVEYNYETHKIQTTNIAKNNNNATKPVTKNKVKIRHDNPLPIKQKNKKQKPQASILKIRPLENANFDPENDIAKLINEIETNIQTRSEYSKITTDTKTWTINITYKSKNLRKKAYTEINKILKNLKLASNPQVYFNIRFQTVNSKANTTTRKHQHKNQIPTFHIFFSNFSNKKNAFKITEIQKLFLTIQNEVTDDDNIIKIKLTKSKLAIIIYHKPNPQHKTFKFKIDKMLYQYQTINQYLDMDKNFEIKTQWTSETLKQITNQEFIIFTNSPHDAALAHKFIENNFLITKKIKASPDFKCFLHIFDAESLDKIVPIWTKFKKIYKFENHAITKKTKHKPMKTSPRDLIENIAGIYNKPGTNIC